MPRGDLSPLTWAAERFFRGLQYCPPQIFFRSRADLTQEEINSPDFTRRRGRRIDALIIFYVAIDAMLLALLTWRQPIGTILAAAVRLLAALRIIDIVQVTVNLAVFDALRGRVDNMVGSMARLVVLSFVNFVELILAFGIVYASALPMLSGAHSVGDAVYFSAVTQFTIGYGDIVPTAWVRWVVIAQGLSSFVFIVLVFARALSNLPTLKEFQKH